MFSNKRYVQYSDKDGNELLGSGHTWVFDQRFSNATIADKVQERFDCQFKAWQKDRRYIKPQYAFFDIKRNDTILESYKIDN